MSDLTYMHNLQAFIDDVKVSERCDTSNMRKVVYCTAHRVVLTRIMDKEKNEQAAGRA